MRNKKIILVLVLLGFSVSLTAQNYRNKQLALISYSYNIHPNIKPQLDEFTYLLPDLQEPKTDKTIAILKNNSWQILKERLEEETNMYILPITAHGKDFKYDEYGYPNMTINRALRKGNARYYIRVSIAIAAYSNKTDKGYGTTVNKDTTKTPEAISEGLLIPEITIEVTTYTRDGILPMQKVVGSAMATEPWVISPSTFDGLKKGEDYKLDDPNNIMGLINSAITNLLRNF